MPHPDGARLVDVVLGQLDLSDGDPAERLREGLRMVATLASRADVDAGGPARLVVLPEMWPVGYFRFDRYARSAEPLDGPLVTALSTIARDAGAWILAGSMVEAGSDGHYNTSVLLDDRGVLRHSYRKTHLFGLGSEEPARVRRGDELGVCRTPWGVLGLLTCYDLRFPEVCRAMVHQGAELLGVVASWPAARIEHWTTLLRARAIENQVWVVAVNAAGVDNGREIGGRSMIVAPDGETVLEMPGGGGADRATIDVEDVPRVRERLPFLADSRFRSPTLGVGRRPTSSS